MKNYKLHREVKKKKTELTGRSQLRRRRSTLNCSAIEEEEEEQEVTHCFLPVLKAEVAATELFSSVILHVFPMSDILKPGTQQYWNIRGRMNVVSQLCLT